jgi:hypothetical protein
MNTVYVILPAITSQYIVTALVPNGVQDISEKDTTRWVTGDELMRALPKEQYHLPVCQLQFSNPDTQRVLESLNIRMLCDLLESDTSEIWGKAHELGVSINVSDDIFDTLRSQLGFINNGYEQSYAKPLKDRFIFPIRRFT